MPVTRTPDMGDALEDTFAGLVTYDPDNPAPSGSLGIRGDEFFKPVQDELLALIAGRVASAAYKQTFTCDAGLAVGSPVYISAAGTVALATGADASHARVVGFVRSKPTTTSALLDHFRYVSGLSGLTAGSPVYLTDAGSFSATPGAVKRVVGIAISTTEALLVASPVLLLHFLSELLDVDLTSLADGSILRWSAGGAKWIVGAAPTVDEKVKAEATDPTAGYLDAKVDDSTIEVDATSHKARVKALGITDAHVAVANKDGASGTASMRTLGTGAAQAAAGDHLHTGTYCRWRGSSASPPADPAEGDIWNDTTSGNVVKIYAGADWRTLT